MEQDVFEYKRASWLHETVQIIRHNYNRQIRGTEETDKQFIESLLRINQTKKIHPETLNKNQKITYTEEEINEIERKAQIHSEANKFNKTSAIEFQKLEQQNKCNCGCEKGRGQEYSICNNQQQLTFLGPGVALFFLYQKRVMFLIILTALTYGLFSFVTNANSNNYQASQLCQKSQGFLAFYCYFRERFSVQQKSSESVYYQIQLWLGLFIALLWIFGLRIIRVLGTKRNEAIDEMLDSSADYCILLENLPFGDFNEIEIQQFLVGLWNKSETKKRSKQNLQIKSIQITYIMKSVRQMINELELLITNALELIQTSQKAQLHPVPKILSTESVMLENSKKISQEENENIQKSIVNILVRRKQKKRRRSTEKNVIRGRVFKNSTTLPPLKGKQTYLIRSGHVQEYKNLKSQILKLYQKLKDYRWEFLKNSQFRKSISAGTCLVQFVHAQQQADFLQEFGTQKMPPIKAIIETLKSYFYPNESGLTFKQNLIKIKRAPEPSDIEWINSQKENSIYKSLKVWGITFFIVIISLGMLLLIRYIRRQWTPLNNITIVVAVSLQVFNRLIWITVVRIVKFEQNNTKTDAIISIMTKACFAQAVNVIFLPLLMNTYIFDNLSGPNGLVGMVVDYQTTVCFMMMFWNLVDPPYLMKNILLYFSTTRNFIISYLLPHQNGESTEYEHIRPILEFYQPPQFPIAGGYMYISTIINQAVFFCHLQPVLLIFLVFNVGVFYLINKYLLYKRCKIPALTDVLVFESCISIGKNVPLMYGLGSLYFIHITTDNTWYLLPSVICILVTFIVMLNPNKIFTKFTGFLIETFFQELLIQASSTRSIKPPEQINLKPQQKNMQNQEEGQEEENTATNFIMPNILTDKQNLEYVDNINNSLSQQKLKIEKKRKRVSISTESSNNGNEIRKSQPKDKNILQILGGNPLEVLQESNLEDQSEISNEDVPKFIQIESEKQNRQLKESGNAMQNFESISVIEKKSEDINNSVNDNSLIKKIMKKSFRDQQASTRKESYCENSNINQLFNFEKYFVGHRLSKSNGKRSKHFCESFAFCGASKRVSTFNLLPLNFMEQLKKQVPSQ